MHHTATHNTVGMGITDTSGIQMVENSTIFDFNHQTNNVVCYTTKLMAWLPFQKF